MGSVMQPAGCLQAPTQTLLEQLTKGLDNDQTQPSTATVKITKPLEPDGLNLSTWMYDTVNCSITKKLRGGIQKTPARDEGKCSSH